MLVKASAVFGGGVAAATGTVPQRDMLSVATNLIPLYYLLMKPWGAATARFRLLMCLMGRRGARAKAWQTLVNYWPLKG